MTIRGESGEKDYKVCVTVRRKHETEKRVGAKMALFGPRGDRDRSRPYGRFTIGLLVRLTPEDDICGCWVDSGVVLAPCERRRCEHNVNEASSTSSFTRLFTPRSQARRYTCLRSTGALFSSRRPPDSPGLP